MGLLREIITMPLGLTKQEKRALSILALVLLLCLVGLILF